MGRCCLDVGLAGLLPGGSDFQKATHPSGQSNMVHGDSLTFAPNHHTWPFLISKGQRVQYLFRVRLEAWKGTSESALYVEKRWFWGCEGEALAPCI